ncbi:YbaB/EbfC DNA-binding family protein [Streptomyces sp. TLI_235]|nr:YbaB/EbfC family nucleoid-associated protein [Streptomyces sp. TLI_235]PBC69550.1 YbaB/EbfC DNA-binding family protein [Streptomyces sp. TLI_235]
MDDFPTLDLDEIRQRVESRMAEFSAMHQKMQQLSVSVTSAQHLLTVTVGAQGEVTALKFHSDGYRSMAPSELEHIVLDTLQRARRQVLDQAKALAAPLAPAGLDIDDIMAGRIDPAELTKNHVFDPAAGWGRRGTAAPDDEED